MVQDILNKPTLFIKVFKGITDNDPLIRMRSADVIEKVSARHPDYLQPFKEKMINEVSKIEQQEVRWHLAQMFSYIKLNKKERDAVIKILLFYIENDKSKIVKTFSIQTLADFAERDVSIRPQVINIIEKVMKKGSPAIVNRGRKLLHKLSP